MVVTDAVWSIRQVPVNLEYFVLRIEPVEPATTGAHPQLSARILHDRAHAAGTSQ